ncbi:MAG: hypothetical protein KJN76_13880, partial [Eudoraea sp.]|nr:hypothetical protein [Eudoraea sp.]
MKKYIIILSTLLLILSCAENPKKEQELTESDFEFSSESKEDQIELDPDDLEVSMEQLGEFLKMGKDGEDQNDTTSVKSVMGQFGKIMEMSGFDPNELIADSIQQKGFSTEAFMDMLEKSGVSREQMVELLNNPDSLRILAEEAVKNRQLAKKEETLSSKRSISKEQLTSKSTSTGVSLEDAILIVQAESGPEATMAKLKKIDSLAGTNVMEQLDLTEAGYLMTDVARKNETPASPEEEKWMKDLRDRSGQLHSEKEANDLLAELEKAENDITSGSLKVSPRVQRTIEHQKKTVLFHQKNITRKSAAAKKKFQKLNPELYFGEEVGQTYFGGPHKTAVYLPLGALSFADKIIKANHPQLMTQEVKNV